jgi:hypothetical protein
MVQIGTQSVTTGGPASPDAMPQRKLIGPVGTGPARNRPRSSAWTAIEVSPTRISTLACCGGRAGEALRDARGDLDDDPVEVATGMSFLALGAG